MKLPPLVLTKPSVILAEKLEYFSAGESTIAVFAYLFLLRLPWEIPVLLSEDNPADMQEIADKANRLTAMHVPQGHYACPAVAADEDLDVSNLVATTQGVRRKKFKLPAAKHPQQQ